MDTNLMLILISSGILIAVFTLANRRFQRLDIFDLFVLMVGAFFGAYTLIDALVNELLPSSPALALWVHVAVVLMTGLAWLAIRLLPADLQRRIELRHLFERWSQVGTVPLLALFAYIMATTALIFVAFGIGSQDDLQRLTNAGIALPFWATALRLLGFPLAVACFGAASARLMHGDKATRWLWVIIMVLTVAASTVYGRRTIFALLTILVLMWSFKHKVNLFRPALVWAGVIGIAFLLMLSNLFQNYRDGALSASNLSSGGALVLLESATDSESTVRNLQVRLAMWQYNYLILLRQPTLSPGETPYGDIFAQGVMNTVPSALWPGKTFVELDALTARTYMIPELDYPANIFVTVQADFGHFALLFVPVLLFLLVYAAAVAARVSERSPMLFLVVSGMFATFFVSIESNYAEMILTARHVLLAFFVYWGYRATRAALRPEPLALLRFRRSQIV